MFWTRGAKEHDGLDQTTLHWTELVRIRTPLWYGSSRVTGAGPSYTSVLMLQLRVNMSLMVTERARLGLR